MADEIEVELITTFALSPAVAVMSWLFPNTIVLSWFSWMSNFVLLLGFYCRPSLHGFFWVTMYFRWPFLDLCRRLHWLVCLCFCFLAYFCFLVRCLLFWMSEKWFSLCVLVFARCRCCVAFFGVLMFRYCWCFLCFLKFGCWCCSVGLGR